ncbi:RAF protein [Aphelenchoides avenae]|nr:RAF protein [Aphelenchus avenae]
MVEDAFILLHLPFDQHSKVRVQPGVSAWDKFSSILEKRKMEAATCTVCIDADPQSPQIDRQMDLQALARQLSRNELWVHSERMELFKSIEHDYVQETFLPKTNCNGCRKEMHQGYRCKRCLFKFHEHCGCQVPTFCDWEISHDKVTIEEQIGRGSYGTVYKAHYIGHPVAVKKLNIGNPDSRQLAAFKNEVSVLKKMSHVNVLNILGVIREPELAIVTQWCEGSSLYYQIHVAEPFVEFEMQTILDICQEISQGMEYLHSKGVIHRDLKTNNIFLTEGASVKIGDFGLATVKTRWENGQGGELKAIPTGSILWMAPEVIRMRTTNPHSTASDVYSFGVCLYELLSSRLPYDHINNRDQILFMVGSGVLRPNMEHIRNDVPHALRTLLEQCVEYEPEKRPEFSEIYELLDGIRLPKLKKSASAPNLGRLVGVISALHSSTASPKTPKSATQGRFFGGTSQEAK